MTEELERAIAQTEPPPLELRLGNKLGCLLDPTQGRAFYTRVMVGLAAWSRDWGIPLPVLSFAPGHELGGNEYRFSVDGQSEAFGESQASGILAVAEPSLTQGLLGLETHDPIYHLPAKWISSTQTQKARELGCIVFDPAALIITHMLEVLGREGWRFLTLDSCESKLEKLAAKKPALVREAGRRLTLPKTVHLLRNLAKERVAVADLGAILEGVVEAIEPDEEPGFHIVDRVRSEIGAIICSPLLGPSGELLAAAVTKGLEERLKAESHEGLTQVEPDFLTSVVGCLTQELSPLMQRCPGLVLVVDFELRSILSQLLRRQFDTLPILAWSDIPPWVDLRVVAEIGSRLHPRARPIPRRRYEISTRPKSDATKVSSG